MLPQHPQGDPGRRSAVLAGTGPLPYFRHMKLTPFRAGWGLLLLVLAGCSIEEVGEHRETGTLYFRAQNAYDAQEAVTGLLEIGGRGGLSFSGGAAYLAISGLPLDSNLVLHFTPSSAEDWFPAGDLLFRFSAGVSRDTLNQLLYPRADSLLSVTVRTVTGSGERAGMPIWLDGQRWAQDSPATLFFTSLASHQLVVGDEHCTRADTLFSYDAQPVGDLLVNTGSVTLAVDPGVDGQVVLDGTTVGPGVWSQVDPALGSYFFSAFRPGHAATPAWARLSGLCGGEQAFSWTPVAEGYVQDRLFPDFALGQVLPGQAGTVGDFHLSQLRGRLVLVTFWYATCVNCLLEMPGFQSMLEEYGGRGFRVVAMDPYPTDQPENYPEQVLDYDFTFLRDVGSPPVAQLAGVGAFPTNFLILPDGRIHSVRGGMSEETLESLLIDLLPE
jgi:thiol-disulfide isomerase/thioredoxin